MFICSTYHRGEKMGASSVTGIGCGSAGKSSLTATSSNPNDSCIPLSISNLMGPRIIAAGVMNLKEEDAEIVFTAPSGSVDEYTVFLQDNNKMAIVSSNLKADAHNSNWSFHITGKPKTTISWMVIKLGIF